MLSIPQHSREIRASTLLDLSGTDLAFIKSVMKAGNIVSARTEASAVSPVLENLVEITLTLEWLRRGFAAFLWDSGRSLASLHFRAARALAGLPTARRPREGTYFQLAGSFIQYLFERQGIERLRRFFRRAESVGLDAASRVAFGKSLGELQGEWRSMLDDLPR